MQAQRERDTAPELHVRRAVHRLGLRYRVDAPLPLPGARRRCDLLFSGPQVAVFVDSCFWHACPEHGTWPKANADWWQEKLLRNRERDRDTDARLRSEGWKVIRVWEHEDHERAALRIERVVRVRRRERSNR